MSELTGSSASVSNARGKKSQPKPAVFIPAATVAVVALAAVWLANLSGDATGVVAVAKAESPPDTEKSPAKKLAPPSADEQKRLVGEVDEVYKAAQDKKVDETQGELEAIQTAQAALTEGAKGVQQVRQEHEAILAAQEKLKTDPDNADACLAVGRWLCFYEGNWDSGLKLLAKGSDAALKSLAAEELASKPSKADDKVTRGDAWWDLGEKATGKSKAAMRRRAGQWYQEALPELASGLGKSRVEKRLAQAAVEPVAETASGRAHIRPPLAVAPFNENMAVLHQKRWAKYLGVSVVQTNSIGMKLALIPPGEFQMGASTEQIAEELRGHGPEAWFKEHIPEEGPQHRVRITNPFWLASTCVTQEEYQRVMARNPSRFTGDPQRPVEYVSWEDATEFCRKLSAMPGEKAVNRRYSLPTEAQWEYACRAGNLGRWCFSAQPNPLPLAVEEKAFGEFAWYSDNCAGSTHPVGQKRPNAWGLHDVHGNVREWCSDWYDGKYYADSPVDDPPGPKTGSGHSARGGLWYYSARDCRCSNRYGRPGLRYDYVGFRVRCDMVKADDETGGDVSSSATADEPAATSDVPRSPKTWLSDLPEQDVQVGLGDFGKHGWAGFDPAPISMFGMASPQGLGLHPDGHVEYVPGKRYRTFRGTAAMDDSAEPRSQRPIDFRVLGDGKLLWESRGLHGRSDAQPCLLDITGVDVLRLEVMYRPGTKGDQGHAHAVWIEPYVAADPPAKDVLALFDPARYKLLETEEDLKSHVRALLQKEDFAALEEEAVRWRKSDVSPRGLPMLGAYYTPLSAPADRSNKAWEEHFARLEHWRKAKPDSITPLISLGGSCLQYAAQARGTGYAYTVGPAAAKALEERVDKARGYLEEAEKMKTPDPELYLFLLGVELYQGNNKDQAFRYFEQGRKINPRYALLYSDLGNYLLPQWHGETGELEAYAAKLRKESGGLGDLIYFRMACVQNQFAQERLFGDAHFRYEDVLPGLRVAIRDYPESFFLYNNACLMACVAGDKNLASKLLTRLDIATFWLQLWRGYGWFDYWRRQIDPQAYAGEDIKTLFDFHGRVASVAFLKDGRLVSGSEFPGVKLWNTETGKATDTVETSLPVGMLAIDGAGRRMIVAHGLVIDNSSDKVAVIYSLDGKQEPRPLVAHSGGVTSVAMNRAGNRCGTAARENDARIWNLDALDKPITLKHPEWVYDIAFSADGKTVATSSYQGGVWLWDAETGKPLDKPLVEMNQGPWQCHVAFVGDKTLITASIDGTIRRWDVATRKYQEAKPLGGWIDSLAVSPDGNWLAVGRRNGIIHLLAVDTLTLAHAYAGHCGSCGSVCFSADSRTLASGSIDCTIKLWRVAESR